MSPAHVSNAPASEVPDLLNADPLCTIDVEQTGDAFVFAFAGSTTGGLFADALAQAQLAPSTWQADGFAADLFVQDLVRRCFQARVSGRSVTLTTQHLLRVVTSPPAEPRSVYFRREILSELSTSPGLRAGIEDLYLKLSRFRGLLEGTAARGKWDQNRRQLDLLRLFHDVVQTTATRFVNARSGLQRLHEFGRSISDSEPYQSLVELLRYDEHLATVSFRLGVGADGRVRQLDLVSVEENRANPFVVSPVRRWLAKVELLLRGYRLSEGEVMARFLDAVFEGVRGRLVALVQLLGDLEFYLGALGFAEAAQAKGLQVCLPELSEPSRPREFHGLFNPLLLGAGVTPVPCDVATERHDLTLLITGPNSGGKTRLLQALGLAQLMAQGGLFVPARAARMALAPGLVVSLIQETKVDQSEGRLGVELMRIRTLFEQLPAGAVVLLDELCSGTNPSEGEEIVELVLRALTRLRPQAYITTHFLQFAARMQREGRIADLRFLQVVLADNYQPTYQFAPGVAETSLAAVAAARLGVTGEQLMELVDRQVGPARPVDSWASRHDGT